MPAAQVTRIDVLTPLRKYSKDCRRHRIVGFRKYWVYLTSQPEAELNLGELETAMAMRMIDPLHIQAYLHTLKEQCAKHSTGVQFRQTILFLASYLADLGLISYIQADRLQKIELPRLTKGSRPGIWLNREQARLLIQSTQNASELDLPTRVRNQLILMLMIYCGLRREEVVKAEWTDIFELGTQLILRVHGKGAKTRFVSLPPKLQNVLNEWKAISDCKGPVFRPIRRKKVGSQSLGIPSVYNLVKDAGQRIGVPGLGPHDLRRTCARLAYEAAAPIELIRQLLGHSSVKMTERYIKPLLELAHAATDVVATEFSDDFKALEEDEITVVSQPTVSEEKLFNRQEAAVYLNISTSQFDRWCKKVQLLPDAKGEGKTRPFNLYRCIDLDRFNSISEE